MPDESRTNAHRERDDFGISHGVNLGIIEAHVRGVVTSTRAMPRWPAAREAARFARENPGLGIGLRVDLGERVYRDDPDHLDPTGTPIAKSHSGRSSRTSPAS